MTSYYGPSLLDRRFNLDYISLFDNNFVIVYMSKSGSLYNGSVIQAVERKKSKCLKNAKIKAF